jgi:PadR family transcriptional regulator, regulatory protein AphA
LKLEHRVLGLLCLKPHTGYDIKKYLDTEGRFMRGAVHFSQLYPTLKNLVRDGLISFVEEQREGRPDAKIYTITLAGREYFLDWLRSPLEFIFDHRDNDLVGRLVWGGMLDKAMILRMLHNELDFRNSQIAKYRHRDRALKGIVASEWVDPERQQFMLELLHEDGAAQMDTYVAWIQRTIERVEQNLPGQDPLRTDKEARGDQLVANS